MLLVGASELCRVSDAAALGALRGEDTRRPSLREFRAGLRLAFRDKVASVDLAQSHYAAFLQFWTSC